jgi:tRNA A37 methylthiotransferase MiaB
VSVLFENKIKNENKYFGRDEYFNSVIVTSNENLIGEIKNVKILESVGNTLFGENVSNLNQKNCAA